jgi:hypothetical protein
MSVSGRGAVVWAAMHPSVNPSKGLRPDDFRGALRLWMGRPLNEELNLGAAHCFCGKPALPTFGASHMGSCTKGAGGHRIGRHRWLQDELYDICHESGLAVTREPKVDAPEDHNAEEKEFLDGSRTDLHVERLRVDARGPKGQRNTKWINVHVDVAFAEPGTDTGLSNGSATHRGAYAAVAANRKRRKYAGRVEKQGYVFLPFIVETPGFFHEDALKFLKLITEHVTNSANIGMDVSAKELAIIRASLMQRFLQRVSTAAQCAVVTCIRRASNRLALRPSFVTNKAGPVPPNKLQQQVSIRALDMVGRHTRSANSALAALN